MLRGSVTRSGRGRSTLSGGQPATDPPAPRSRLGPVNVAPRASIALALAYVAGGRFDGFVQVGGSLAQDVAAGLLLIREAGGKISGSEGKPDIWKF